MFLRGVILNANFREDDANWPKKNIVGKQELEIRIGNDHIAFEVYLNSHLTNFETKLSPFRPPKSVLSSTCKTVKTLKGYGCSTISYKI